MNQWLLIESEFEGQDGETKMSFLEERERGGDGECMSGCLMRERRRSW